jgi:hypothetical protein
MFGEDTQGATAFLEFLVHEFPPEQLSDETDLSAADFAENHEFLSSLSFVTPSGGDECCVLTPKSEKFLHTFEPPSVSSARAHITDRQQWSTEYDQEIVVTANDYFKFDASLIQVNTPLKVRLSHSWPRLSLI